MDPLVRRKLGRTNIEVTQLGFGGAGLGDLFDVVDDADAGATLQAAWDAGIRYYDTSPWYGRGGANTASVAHYIAVHAQTTYCQPRLAACSVPSTMRRISSMASGAVD